MTADGRPPQLEAPAPEDCIRTDAMIAGYVERYHTWPGNVRQDIAAHTWHVLRVMYMIWHDLPPDVVKHVMFHDAGELRTGDLPYPIKRIVPALKEIMDKLEEKSLEDQGLVVPGVNAVWAVRVKTAHTIEMFEFALHQLLSGNRYHALVARRMRDLLKEQLAKLDPVDAIRVTQYVTAREERYEHIVNIADEEW